MLRSNKETALLVRKLVAKFLDKRLSEMTDTKTLVELGMTKWDKRRLAGILVGSGLCHKLSNSHVDSWTRLSDIVTSVIKKGDSY